MKPTSLSILLICLSLLGNCLASSGGDWSSGSFKSYIGYKDPTIQLLAEDSIGGHLEWYLSLVLSQVYFCSFERAVLGITILFDVLQSAYESVAWAVSSVYDTVYYITRPILSVVTTIWSFISEVARIVWGVLRPIFSGLYNIASTICNAVYDFIKLIASVLSKGWSLLSDGVRLVFDGLLRPFGSALCDFAYSIYRAIYTAISYVYHILYAPFAAIDAAARYVARAVVESPLVQTVNVAFTTFVDDTIDFSEALLSDLCSGLRYVARQLSDWAGVLARFFRQVFYSYPKFYFLWLLEEVSTSWLAPIPDFICELALGLFDTVGPAVRSACESLVRALDAIRSATSSGVTWILESIASVLQFIARQIGWGLQRAYRLLNAALFPMAPRAAVPGYFQAGIAGGELVSQDKEKAVFKLPRDSATKPITLQMHNIFAETAEITVSMKAEDAFHQIGRFRIERSQLLLLMRHKDRDGDLSHCPKPDPHAQSALALSAADCIRLSKRSYPLSIKIVFE